MKPHLPSLRDAARAVEAAARRSPAEGRRLCAQREFVELLLACPNVGLREYRLPMLLDGSVAGGVATELRCDGSDVRAISAVDTGRGWRLDGEVAPMANVPDDQHLVALPVALGPRFRFSVVMLGSDQDGLHRLPTGDVRSHEAALRVAGVFYRDDETLADDGPALLRAVAPSWRRLRRALALGQARHRLAG